MMLNQASLSILGTYLNAKVSCSFFRNSIKQGSQELKWLFIGLSVISLYYVLTSSLAINLFLHCIYLYCWFLQNILEKKMWLARYFLSYGDLHSP